MAEVFGRIGYVLNGFSNREPGKGGGKEIRCMGCRTWFPEANECPECGWTRPGFNKEIRTKQLNRHLLGYASTANSQPRFAPNITSDVNLPK